MPTAAKGGKKLPKRTGKRGNGRAGHHSARQKDRPNRAKQAPFLGVAVRCCGEYVMLSGRRMAARRKAA